MAAIAAARTQISRLLGATVLLLLASGLMLALAERLVPTQPLSDREESILEATTRADFQRDIEPLAVREAQLVLYNHAASFPAFWSEVVIPRFEARYGIHVVLRNVQANMAHQQLMAAHAAHRPSPADVFFTSAAQLPVYVGQKLMLDTALAERLPQAAFYERHSLYNNQGVSHGGRFIPFHRNQAAWGYDSAKLKPEDVPMSLDALLHWAKAHPGRLAWASPQRGGTGQALLVAVARHTMSKACRERFESSEGALAAQQAAGRWLSQSECLSATWAWLRQLRAVSELTNGNAESLNLLANGSALLTVAWEDQAHTFVTHKQLPASFRMVLPLQGLPGGIDGMFIPAGARHTAAAALFIDFALSQEIQRWKLEHMASRSTRADVPMTLDGAHLVPPAQLATRSQPWPSPLIVQALVDGFVENVLRHPGA